MKSSILLFFMFLLSYSFSQNVLKLEGLSANHEGVVGWNMRSTKVGHAIPEPYNKFNNLFAYYYLRSRTINNFDPEGKGGMHGTSIASGFVNLNNALNQNNKTLQEIHIDFTDTDLKTDTKTNEWNLINDTEYRTYTGGKFAIKLNQDTLVVGDLGTLKMIIDYNNDNTPYDDVIKGKTAYTYAVQYDSTRQNNITKLIAKALLKDIGLSGVRLSFNGIQPAGQTEYDNGDVFAGYFNITDASLETSTVSLPNFQDIIQLCDGQSITLDAGAGFSNYLWNTGATNQTLLITQAGNYHVSFEYNGESYTSKTVKVEVKPTIKPSFNEVGPICAGENLSALPSYSYNGIKGSWSPALDNKKTTTYSFTPDAGQCASTATLTITVNNKPVIDTNITQIKCGKKSSGKIEVIVNEGKSPYTYHWNSDPQSNQINTSDKTLSSQSNLDEVSGVSIFVSDANGCMSNTISNIAIKSGESKVTINPIKTFIMKTDAEIELVGNPTGGKFTGPNLNLNKFNPANASLGKKVFTYTYNNGNGCSDSTNLIVYVVDSIGNSCNTYDTILKVKFKLTTGIKANQITQMNVYPNPTSDILILEVNDIEALKGYSYKLIDLNGKVVFTKQIEELKTEISMKLIGAKGNYILEVLDANSKQVQTNKIILE